MGGQIARNAWPARLARDGTLHVNTSSAAWAFELAQLESTVREQLGELAPPKLRFAPGPLPEPLTATGDEAAATRPQPTSEERLEAVQLARPIEDEKLRKLVARAAAASLATGRSGRSF